MNARIALSSVELFILYKDYRLRCFKKETFMKNKRVNTVKLCRGTPSRLRKSLELENAECKENFGVLLPSTGQNAKRWRTEMDAQEGSHGDVEAIAMLDVWQGPNVIKLIGRNPRLRIEVFMYVYLNKYYSQQNT